MNDPAQFLPASGAYSLSAAIKRPMLLAELNRLTAWHAQRSPAYARILAAMGWSAVPAEDLSTVPFLPAQLFKRVLLASVPDTEIVRTMHSSGTSGQAPSRIVLDQFTAGFQARALGHLLREFVGPHRLPMVIVDEPVRHPGAGFTARGAGQLGFAPLGREHFFLLKPGGEPDLEGLRGWLSAHGADRIIFFGMTASIWEHLLDGPVRQAGIQCTRPALLIHGGGWKKLAARQVSPPDFKTAARALNITETRDYYGMIEQTGSIHVEDDDGPLLAPLAGEVLVRHPRTLAPLPMGETGLLQVFSVLPHSYPGHSILTEDVGRIVGVDDSPAGRQGTRFVVLGRLPSSELRGCSDTTTP